MGGINEDITSAGCGGRGYGFGYSGIAELLVIAGLFGGRGFGFGGFGGGVSGGFNERGRELEMAFDGTNRNIDGLRAEIESNKIATQLGNQETRNEVRFNSLKDCCCETGKAIDRVDFHNAIIAKDNIHIMDKGFCSVKEAVHCDGDKTRALINAIDREALRDKLAKAEFEVSQLRQNEVLARMLDHKLNKAVTDIAVNYGTITKTQTNSVGSEN